MTKINKKELEEFLYESNYIEREYGKTAFVDALKAWNFLIEKENLSLENILETHKILMYNLNAEIAGEIRNCDVRVGYRVCPSYTQVEMLLEKWLEMHANAKTEEEIKTAHIVFEGVHPFIDGNGRTGRIIYNYQRIKNNLPIHIIHEGLEQQKYYTWFN